MQFTKDLEISKNGQMLRSHLPGVNEYGHCTASAEAKGKNRARFKQTDRFLPREPDPMIVMLDKYRLDMQTRERLMLKMYLDNAGRWATKYKVCKGRRELARVAWREWVITSLALPKSAWAQYPVAPPEFPIELHKVDTKATQRAVKEQLLRTEAGILMD
jgi:hypothetical protein